MLVFWFVAIIFSLVKADCPIPLKNEVSLKDFRENDTLILSFEVRKCEDGVVLQFTFGSFNEYVCEPGNFNDTDFAVAVDAIGYVQVFWTLKTPVFRLITDGDMYSIVIWGNKNAQVLDKTPNTENLEEIQEIVNQMLSERADEPMQLRNPEFELNSLKDFQEMPPMNLTIQLRSV